MENIENPHDPLTGEDENGSAVGAIFIHIKRYEEGRMISSNDVPRASFKAKRHNCS